MSYQCLNPERQLYFKTAAAKALSSITKIIFDFDGVLVQTLQSYGQTIKKVVDYYFLEILGLEGKKGKLVTLKDIQQFKDTGLYNNDWNLAYAIITYYPALLLKKLQQKRVFQDFASQFGHIQCTELPRLLQTLEEVGSFLRRYELDAAELVNLKNDRTLGLESFLAQTTRKNPNPLKTTLALVFPQIGSKQRTLITRLVPYHLEKPDLLKRLFEESYLGEKLFNKFYGIPSIFRFSESFLEKETFIPTKKTLNWLRPRLGKFAVYSEKPRAQGVYLLEKNDAKEYFNEEDLVFLEDLVNSSVNGEGVRLGKPNPTLFIKLIDRLAGKNSEVAYVGDGVADALLAENARHEDYSNLQFLGVLCSSQDPNTLLARYITHEADAIMTDVNDIPDLFTMLRGRI